MKTEKIKCEFQFPLITSLEIAQNPLLEKVNGLGVVFLGGEGIGSQGLKIIRFF